MKIRRRDFLKMAGMIGAGAVISLYTFDIAKVFAQATDGSVPPHVVWLQGAGDTGCTISLLQGADPDLVDVIREFKLSVDFHPTIMIPTGDEALNALEDVADSITPLDVLIVEGAVPTGNYCTVGEIAGMPVPFENWVKVLGDKAKYIVAVGTCAAFGGIPAAIPNPTRCRSVAETLEKELREIINIAGCPPHPDWITLTLATVLPPDGIMPKLDKYGRPKEFFKDDIHERCLLRKRYEEEKFASYPSEPGCLFKIGCKGKKTRGDCPTRLWNNGVSYCTGGLWEDGEQIYPAGAPCIGCTEPEFPEHPFSPFYVKLPEEK